MLGMGCEWQRCQPYIGQSRPREGTLTYLTMVFRPKKREARTSMGAPRPKQAQCLDWCGGVVKTVLWWMRDISTWQDIGGCLAHSRAAGVNHTIEQNSTLNSRGVDRDYRIELWWYYIVPMDPVKLDLGTTANLVPYLFCFRQLRRATGNYGNGQRRPHRGQRGG